MFINILLNMIILYEINGIPLSKKEILLKQNKLEENPDLFEGDMRFPVSTQTRGVLRRGDSVAWTNGIVPYEIAPGYGSTEISLIISTMQKMERLIARNNVICIQFRPRISTDRYYITIRNGRGCSSYVGQNTGVDTERTVSLESPECLIEGTIMHELLHTLGFFHEQTRPDRDSYIRVNYENIISGQAHNFEKYNNSYVDTLNTPYDYSSVMHYPRDSFSSNRLPTIEPLQSNVSIGQRYNMSSIDIEEVRLFYNCSSSGSTFATIPTTTTVNLYTLTTSISSALTTNSCLYDRSNGSNPDYFYESYAINVPLNGYYRFKSNSSIDTYGYLYSENFDPSSPSLNLIKSDDQSGGNDQFQLEVYLQSNMTYVLVLTTYTTLTVGNYQLIAQGLYTVNMRKSNNLCSATATITTTTSNQIISIYYSSLTINSLTLHRDLGSKIYYYEPIIILVPLNGLYRFRSNSSVDSYGYLYVNYFNPFNLTENLLAFDDNNGGNSQFLIQYQLESNKKYILIKTTYSPNITTHFSIIASGPGSVYFNSIGTTTQSTYIPIFTTSCSSQFNMTPIYGVFHLLIVYLILMIIH